MRRALLPLIALTLQAATPELALPAMAPIGVRVWVARLALGAWVTSFTHRMDDGMVVPANGLAIVRGGRCALVDPGWEPAQTRALLAWARRRGWKVEKAVVTHSHADRSAGIAELRRAGIPAVGLASTAARLKAEGKAGPEPVPGLESTAYQDPLGFELFFPGAGHAPDNLVVWLPEAKLLYGGCFLKASTAEDLGNLADADLRSWPEALEKVAARWPGVAIQVPGHGALRGNAIGRTRALLAQAAPR